MTPTEPMIEAAARAMYVWKWSESKASREWDCNILFDKQPHISRARAALTAALAASDMVMAPREPTEAMIDAPRGAIMYFNGQQSAKWTLGQHADAGGYPFGAVLTDEERKHFSFPKAHQAIIIYRAMLSALSPSQPDRGAA